MLHLPMLRQTIAKLLIKFNFYSQCLFDSVRLLLAAAGAAAAAASFSATCITKRTPLGSS